MSDRIAVMRAGHIEQLGPPEELYERPATEFVAGFLGVSNLLEGDVAGNDGGLTTVRLADGTLLRAPSGMVDGTPSVRVGVRPRSCACSPSTTTRRRYQRLNSIDATILDASYIGVSTQYLVETSEGRRLRCMRRISDQRGRRPGRGQRVQLTWKPQHTFVIGPSEPSPQGAPMPDDRDQLSMINAPSSAPPPMTGFPVAPSCAGPAVAACWRDRHSRCRQSWPRAASVRRRPRGNARRRQPVAARAWLRRRLQPGGRAQLRELAVVHRHRRQGRDQAQDDRGLPGRDQHARSRTPRTSRTTSRSSGRSSRSWRRGRTPATT